MRRLTIAAVLVAGLVLVVAGAAVAKPDAPSAQTKTPKESERLGKVTNVPAVLVVEATV